MIAFRYLALFVVVLLLLPLVAMAEETKKKDNQTQKWTIILGLVTQHIDPSDDTNESSRMLGLSYSNWAMAHFTNSYDEASVFCGRRFQTKELRHPHYTVLFREIYMPVFYMATAIVFPTSLESPWPGCRRPDSDTKKPF